MSQKRKNHTTHTIMKRDGESEKNLSPLHDSLNNIKTRLDSMKRSLQYL